MWRLFLRAEWDTMPMANNKVECVVCGNKFDYSRISAFFAGAKSGAKRYIRCPVCRTWASFTKP